MRGRFQAPGSGCLCHGGDQVTDLQPEVMGLATVDNNADPRNLPGAQDTRYYGRSRGGVSV